jgi:hypothetical protein
LCFQAWKINICRRKEGREGGEMWGKNKIHENKAHSKVLVFLNRTYSGWVEKLHFSSPSSYF